MLIITEGPDKIGKTTMLNILCKKMNCIIIKNFHRPTSSDDTKLKNSYLTIYEFIKKYHKDYNIILDRYYPSQLVYSVLRGKDSFKDVWYNDFENKIKKLQHLYVYCTIDFEILKSRHLIDADDYLKLQYLKKVITRYNSFYKQTKLNKIKIDLYPDNLVQTINLLQTKIQNG